MPIFYRQTGSQSSVALFSLKRFLLLQNHLNICIEYFEKFKVAKDSVCACEQSTVFPRATNIFSPLALWAVYFLLLYT